MCATTDRQCSPHPPTVQTLPHGGYQPYNQPYNPSAVAYNNDQEARSDEEGEEEEGEEDPYYHSYPYRYGYPSDLSEDVELRSPGVVRRLTRNVFVTEENDKEDALTPNT